MIRTPKTNKRRVHRFLRSSCTVVMVGIVILVAVALYVGGRLVAPASCVVGPPPADLPAEVVSIAKPSGDVLAGWFAPGDQSRGTIVLLHPLRGSRRSMVDRARLFYREGYSLLLVDFQAHGESPGRHITAGHLESHDVRAVVDYARSRRPDRPIGVVGVSLGGAAALLASPLGVDAMVLESVYPTIDEAVHNRVRRWLGPLHHIPSWLLLVQLDYRLGISPSELRPIDHVSDIDCPVLVLGGSVDQHTTLEETKRLFEVAAEPKRIAIFDGAAHVDLQQFAPEFYADTVLPFVGEFMQSGERDPASPPLARISHHFVGRNEQTPLLPERRSLRLTTLRQQIVKRVDCVCAAPAGPCDLGPAYDEKCGLERHAVLARNTASCIRPFFRPIPVPLSVGESSLTTSCSAG